METVATKSESWQEANQRFLTAAIGVVRDTLEQHRKRHKKAHSTAPQAPRHGCAARDRLADAAERLPSPSALDVLCQTFGLSSFEREVLLLCAGVELDSSFAELCAAPQGAAQSTHPTFSLALAALADAHWSALTPGAALRHWRLIEVVSGDSSLSTSPLRIDERVLHYLTGLRYLDEHLQGFVYPVVQHEEEQIPSHRALVDSIVRLWSDAGSRVPIVQMVGAEAAAKRSIAALAAARFDLSLFVMPAHVVPSSPHDLDLLIRLWEREAVLGRNALLLDCESSGGDDAARDGLLGLLLEGIGTPVFVASSERKEFRHRPSIIVDVNKPTTLEQRALWRESLGETLIANGSVDRLVAHFNLSVPAIRAASRQISVSHSTAPDESFDARLWAACRSQARPRLGSLAQRIEAIATWNDIVLPSSQLRTLREITLHVRQRALVYETWGFAARSSRGLGISAIFSGPSGTGKTMAAEVLANELRLDLYHIDLSRVVSKYIGETEKNLGRVFDAAEEGGAILLFDEADALFGKRSEVKDSHDRYANIEVSYLLQRMESYRGLAILTTNMKEAIDRAFLRRIRFIVSFPFPDVVQRARIWRSVFPPLTPTEGLDTDQAARLNVSGGSIRNIAMGAAVLAAGESEPVRMAHVLKAARSEYAKLDKPLTGQEVRGWA